MSTYLENCCRVLNCPPERFARRIFWRSVPPLRACFVAPIMWVRPGFFRADFDTIEAAGHLESESALQEELSDFRRDARNRRWLRRTLKLRISTRRLHALLTKCRRQAAAGETDSPARLVGRGPEKVSRIT